MIHDYRFSTEIGIRINEINYGGHLGNDSVLSLFQEARLRYLKQFEFSEMNIGDNTSLIMSQAHINFKAEAFWSDQLTVFVQITKIEKVRFNFDYLIVLSQNKNKVIVNGYTEMVGFDYLKRKVKKLPAKFVASVKNFEKS